ncbi:MAG: hypothetical protein MRY77_05655 [Rhodobacteraceae bacterium]|nr:hypothetical protein [Paracoccaceae bacterium]
MAQNVISGDEIVVEWGTDGVTYAVIKGCKTVGIPEETQEYRDRTSLDSPGRSKEYGTGMTDTSELTLSCFYSKELYALAKSYKASGNPIYIRNTLPAMDDQSAGDTFVYQAFVNPSVPAVDVDGDLMTDLKLRPTGVVTWTEGAAA